MHFHDRVRLDRYAIKNPDAELKKGDMVIASMQRKFERDGRTVESREIGYVAKINGKGVYDVHLETDNGLVVEKGIPRHRMEYVVERSYEDICRRVAKAVASIEPEDKRDSFQLVVQEAMVEEKFIPAGRILSGLGRADYDLTLFNCYVYAIKEDSRKGISDHWARIFETFSRGGGVGWDLSILRPRGAIVKKINGRSSGSVSWAEQFSQITGAVEQGGSRMGACLEALWCWHPDVFEFVQAKSQREEFKTPSGQTVSRNKNLLANANVSVLVSDDFMEAVEKDSDWDLIFPDINDPDYDKQWQGDIRHWRDELKKPIEVYQTIKARKLWDLIIQSAWESGEPGLLFADQANRLSNSWYFARLVCTNPCGEVYAPADGVCNLGHVNLSKFTVSDQFSRLPTTSDDAVKNFDWESFTTTVQMGIRFLDNVTDLNKYHDAAMEKQQMSERRVGLGILGYGEMLIRLGLRYGSEEALKFTDYLMEQFSTAAYLESTELARERGSFPQFDAVKFLQSGFMKNHNQKVRRAVKKHGIRNVTLTTIAPTGSVAALLRTSGGCEPLFDLEYTSATRIGVVKEKTTVADQLTAQFGEDRTRWPNYVVTAQKGITPEEHVRTQATLQRWVDASISKTTNLPRSATVEDVAEIYTLMHQLGCKGGTVYRDGSRDTQVLYVEPEEVEVEVEVVEESDATSIILPSPEMGVCVMFSESSPIGKIHATMRHNIKTGEPIDFFVLMNTGDAGADAEAMGRLISLILRWPNNQTVTQQTRLELVRDQLMGIIGRGQAGIGPNAKWSLPDTIAKVIDKYLAATFPLSHVPYGIMQLRETLADLRNLVDFTEEEFARVEHYIMTGERNGEGPNVDAYRAEMEEVIRSVEEKGNKLPYDICPECGSGTLVTIPGKCPYCRTCGFTRC